jgi:SP family general alpha glucoside:H+ symporter-like MFS transporter
VNAPESVAMMRRVIEMEKSAKKPNHLELFKGTDLRRTLIVCGVYAAQNLTGNLIANQAVYFFERKCTTHEHFRMINVLTHKQRLVCRRTLHSLWASLPPLSK